MRYHKYGIKWCYTPRRGGVTFCRTCNKNTHSNPEGCSSSEHKLLYEDLKRRQNDNHIIKRKVDPEWHIKQIISQKKSNEKLRKEVLTHYGGKCTCCGYDNIDKKIHGKSFLEIDHINGDGNKHRQELARAGDNLYNWLRKNNYPLGFRVLCRACNNAMEPGNTICEIHEWQRLKIEKLINPIDTGVLITSSSRDIIKVCN
jgi:hypothetical protein